MNSAKISAAYAMYCNPNGARRLSKSFQPGKYDVLCARGKKAHESEGNRRFRALVKLHQTKYAACTCKVEKSKVVSHIVNTVRNASPNGGFVKIIDGEYWEAGDRAAKEKVGQTFRDFLHTKYSSSTKAKARTRMERKGNKQESMGMSQMNTDTDGNVNMNMGSDHGSSSVHSEDDSFSNHNDDSSHGTISPTPQRTLFSENASFFQPELATLSMMDTLRSSIHTIDARRSIGNSLRNSLGGSLRGSNLLRCSIQTLEEPQQQSFLRSSIHSFAGDHLMRDSLVSLAPLPLMEGAVINVSKPSDDAPMMMSGIESEFANINMELDDIFEEDLRAFCGSMSAAV